MTAKEQIIAQINRLELDFKEAVEKQDAVAIIGIGSAIASLRWAASINYNDQSNENKNSSSE